MSENQEAKQAAARDAGNRWFAVRQKSRVETMHAFLENRGLDKQTIHDYLSNPEDPEIQKFIDEGNETFYMSLLCTQSREEGHETEEGKLVGAAAEVVNKNMPATNEIDQELMLDLPASDSVNIKEAIAQLRTSAIFEKHIGGRDVVADLKESFLTEILSFIRASGIELPDKYKFLVKNRPLPELGVERGLDDLIKKIVSDAKPEKIKDLTKQGVDPKFAQRRVDQDHKEYLRQSSVNAEETQARIQREIEYIIEHFGDPRVLIDKVLRLENGQLPI